MAAAHVPDKVAFATKPALARAMIERAIAAKVPFAWVTADSVRRAHQAAAQHAHIKSIVQL
jgi:SRSO17 transposase